MNNEQKNQFKVIWTQRLFFALIVSVYCLSRWLLHNEGVTFDCSTLSWYFQFLDVNLLKTDLLNSVLFQHSQPPAFNLFLGVILKLFPLSFAHVFTLFFYTFSLIIYWTMFRILRLFKLNDWIAFIFSTIFILSPDVILYENWLMYTWLSATLLMLSAHSLLLYEIKKDHKNAMSFIFYISVLCLTRSMFHLVFLIGCIVTIAFISSIRDKRIIAVIFLALLSVSSVYVKNYVYFGFFGGSSWLGSNLIKMTTYCKRSQITGDNLSLNDPYSRIYAYPSIIKKTIANSEVFLVHPFSSIFMYPAKYRIIPDNFKPFPAVSATHKLNGQNNMNFYGYIQISKEQLNESISRITGDVYGYIKRVREAWYIYSLPAWSYGFLSMENKNSIKEYLYIVTGGSKVNYISNFSLLVNPILFVFVILFFIYNFMKYVKKLSAIDYLITFNFLVLSVLYVSVLGNCIEIGENNRFRIQTDALLYMAFIISMNSLYQYHKRKDKSST